MGRVGLAAYGLALALSTRSDICELFSKWVRDVVELNYSALSLLLSKGIYIRPPSIYMPEEVSFVTKQTFLDGIMRQKRPLTAIELAHLFANIQTNFLGKALLMGFGQVTQSKAVRDYVNRGENIAKEHIQIVSSYIEKESLPVPMHWDAGVVKATRAPFSDKLMLFHCLLINNVGLSDFGASMGVSMRADIVQLYARLMIETAEYGEDGMNLMISNGWFEKPPSTESPSQS